MPVGQLQCYVDEYDYYDCPYGTEEPLRQRSRLLEDMSYWRTKPDWKQESIRDWKLATNTVLIELLAFRQAIGSIQKNYFDDLQVLFPDVARDFTAIIDYSEKIVDDFNDFFVDTMQLSERIDLEALHRAASEQAKQLMAYIVDMAKAEALDCLGDREAGIKLAEKYL